MDDGITKIPVQNRAEAPRLIKRLWEAQLSDVSIRQTYGRYRLEHLGLKVSDLWGKDLEEAANILYGQLHRASCQLTNLIDDSWPSRFSSECADTRKKLQSTWEDDWETLCDGKRLLHDLHREVPMRLGLLQFKKRVITKMNTDRRRSWVG